MIDPSCQCEQWGLREQTLGSYLHLFYRQFHHEIENVIMKFKSLDISIQIQRYPEISKGNLGKFIQRIKILTLDFPLV